MLKRNWILYLMFLLLSLRGYSQSDNIVDSLQQQLITAEKDTSWIVAAGNLSQHYLSVNLDSAEYYANEMLRRSEEIGYTTGKRMGYEILGAVALYRNDIMQRLTLPKDTNVFKKKT